MNTQVTVKKVQTAFGLAFDIVKTGKTKSGYMPARLHLGSDLPMLAQPRLEGFAAAVHLGLCEKLIIVGKDEKRYKGEMVIVDGKPHPLYQSWAICQMLIKDYGVDPARVDWERGTGTTQSSMSVINEKAGELLAQNGTRSVAILTSYYHVPRAVGLMETSHGSPLFLAAEAVTMARATVQNTGRRTRWRIAWQLGFWTAWHPLIRRELEEMQGIADRDILGSYTARKKGW